MNGLKKRKANSQTSSAPAEKRVKARQPTGKSTQTKAKKRITADSLRWRKAKLPDMFNDSEGFYGLEEVDDVEVIRNSNNTVEFVYEPLTIWQFGH